MSSSQHSARVLTFGNNNPRLFYGQASELCDAACTTEIDVDVVIAFHASRGFGAHYWQAPARPPLHAIDGRPC